MREWQILYPLTKKMPTTSNQALNNIINNIRELSMSVVNKQG